ncbi:MAG: hypothetical protein JW819_13120 [Candidatus Krumholzibacteriota bacterium]|nr:hypothetical protein [Candidatus Krumholzibacteriota bacterium]
MRFSKMAITGPRPALILAALLMALVALPAAAEIWQPLDVGSTWLYERPDDQSEIKTIDRVIDVGGESVTVMLTTVSEWDQGLEQFWSADPEGDVYLWGWWRQTDGFGMLYEPPMHWIDAPLEPSSTWYQEDVAFYSLPDTIFEGWYDVQIVVFEGQWLDLPVGTLFSYGHAGAIEPGDGPDTMPAGVGLDGSRRPRAAARGPAMWYSENVGIVLYNAYELVDFVLTPVGERTWSAVKALY